MMYVVLLSTGGTRDCPLRRWQLLHAVCTERVVTWRLLVLSSGRQQIERWSNSPIVIHGRHVLFSEYIFISHKYPYNTIAQIADRPCLKIDMNAMDEPTE